MMRSLLCTALLALPLVALPLATFAADDPKQKEDLASVIALNGKACGGVVSYTVQAENDFLATCKDGSKYRVFVKDGRVVVEQR
jgi:hypothetical protein